MGEDNHDASSRSDRAARPADFDVDETWIDRLVVLGASGSIDMLSAPWLAEAIDSALGKDPAGIVVDLSEVDFLASAGISVIIATRDKLAPAAVFGVVADGPATHRPLTLLGINQIVPLYRTLDDALTKLVDA